MYKILITDHILDDAIKILKKENFEVEYNPEIDKVNLKGKIKDCDGLIIRGRTKIDREILDNAKKLKIIVRAGVGLDNIDLDYCKTKNVKVFNTPLAPINSVAELTICLILSLLRNLYEANKSLKEGKWLKKYFIGFQLKGKTVGIVGFGRIGYEVAKILTCFGCKIIAFDIDISRKKLAEEIGGEFTTDLDYVLSNSDIITIHLPLNSSTYKMFSKDVLKKMKKDSFLINTSRGGIVDEEALLEMLESGHIAGAALDVFENEPPITEVEKRLISHKNVICTPHIGAQTYEALKQESIEAAEIIVKFFKEEIKES
jgi:Phosphoglycerate dehydrogenase and related dehydrogenases